MASRLDVGLAVLKRGRSDGRTAAMPLPLGLTPSLRSRLSIVSPYVVAIRSFGLSDRSTLDRLVSLFLLLHASSRRRTLPRCWPAVVQRNGIYFPSFPHGCASHLAPRRQFLQAILRIRTDRRPRSIRRKAKCLFPIASLPLLAR